MITIAVTRDDLTPWLKKALETVKNPRAILAAGGRAMRNYIVTHLRRLDREKPNKLGGGRQHFWLVVSRSVQNPVITDRTAVVSVSDPRYRQKVEGGVIRAKRTKFLTIPITPEAYGRAASVLESELGIELVPIGLADGSAGVLAEILPSGAIKAHYILTPSVNQEPDPDALPDLNAMSAVCLTAMQSAVDRQLAKN